jgi:hypothetical protein
MRTARCGARANTFVPMLARAGVADAEFHSFRHTNITHRLQRGERPAYVAGQIGDSIETIYRVYAHVIDASEQGRTARAAADAQYGAALGR